MSAAPRLDVVAVINSSPDTVDMLRIWLQHAGFVVVSTFTWHLRDGQVDLDDFIRQHVPSVVVYDIAPPYEANWRLFEHFRRHPALVRVPCILTTTNAVHVQAFAGDERLYEVIGKPYDLNEIVRAVQNATGQ